MENNIGFKELYDVTLKTTYPIEIGDQKIEIGETIAAFDRIQIANFEEKKNFFNTHGGYDDRAQIWWEETKEIRISLTQGVFSKSQLSIMTGAKLITNQGKPNLLINSREIVETGAGGVAHVKHEIVEPIFVYDKQTGERLMNFSIEKNIISIVDEYRELLIDYYYQYNDNYSVFTIGQSLTNGYLSLEGKTRVKDDITGQVTTGIFKIPKLKLTSNLSMRLGQDAIPIVGRLDAIAVPTGTRGHKQVMELIFLNEDIDSDI